MSMGNEYKSHDEPRRITLFKSFVSLNRLATMLFSLLLHALPVALQFVGSQATPLELQKQQASINKFIKSQAQVSINGVLANIGPNGSKAPGVPAGILIASPSRSDPDCESSQMTILVNNY